MDSFIPISGSPDKENSQSTSESVIIARHRLEKENKKRGNTVASSSSSSSNQYQLHPNPQNQLPLQVQPFHPQAGHAPIFNFYTNYTPNP